MSSAYPEPVQRLIEEFTKLPGVGRRSAERMASYILKTTKPDALRLAQAVTDVKNKVRHCTVCFNLTDTDVCAVCADESRDRSLVLVVEQPRDLISLELTGLYKGVYHVLMGQIDPLAGVSPADLTINELFERVERPERNSGGAAVAEVILGLNPNLEGDSTALYLSDELHKRGVKVTRLARGLPAGSQLEYASPAVLADAIQGRQSV